MSDRKWVDSGQISLYSLAAVFVRQRWLIIGFMLLGGVARLLSVIDQPPLYGASASFLPKLAEAAPSGLTGFASQFGVSIPRGGSEIYAKLLKSHMLLQKVAHDTLVVTEIGGRRIPVMEVFGITDGPPQSREERTVNHLKGIVDVSVDKTDGMVNLAVATPWRSVSLGIVDALVQGLNEYNERVRQAQAASERQFVESRLSVASSELRAAEDRLEAFLRSNRDFVAPQLAFQRDRLQRDVTLRQQLFNSLAQAYEDVRIREVRDTPVITVFESPSAPLSPQPRRRAKKIVVGMMLGAIAGALLGFLAEIVVRTRREPEGESAELVRALAEARDDFRDRGNWFGRRFRKTPA